MLKLHSQCLVQIFLTLSVTLPSFIVSISLVLAPAVNLPSFNDTVIPAGVIFLSL